MKKLSKLQKNRIINPINLEGKDKKYYDSIVRLFQLEGAMDKNGEWKNNELGIACSKYDAEMA